MKIFYARPQKKKRSKLKTMLFGLGFLLILTVLGFFMLSNGYEMMMKQQYPLAYQDIIEKEAKQNNLEPAMVYGLIKAESNFDSDAKSRAGALGLMQITPATFEWLQTKLPGDKKLAEEELLEPEVNVKYGCYLLSLLLSIYSDPKTALCAYNAGMGTVDRWLADPEISKDGVTLQQVPYGETAHYSEAVLQNYQTYQELYQFQS